MTAHARYQRFVGEIGINRREYLYELEYWEMVLISRGYNKRNADMWSATRWQTYNLMAAQAGSDALKKAGIYTPADLIRLPWDSQGDSAEPSGELPTDEEIAELKRIMAEENAANKK